MCVGAYVCVIDLFLNESLSIIILIILTNIIFHLPKSWYDTKQSDGEVPAVLELWGMRSTPSLPSLPGPLWPSVVAPDWALSMG